MISKHERRHGFSLVELVVVIVIIGILAAMAIPRLSRGSAGASDAALGGDLAIVRNAINLYAAEHNTKFPGHGGGDMVDHLTMYTDISGNTNASKTSTYKYGPYLLAIPACPVENPSKPTDVLIDSTNSPPTVVTTGGEGWVYNPNTGEFLANSTATDENGKGWNEY
ncbi:MAG: prepilin-type N-terminal cleavage/methylation domain-containing protein [Phycisphaerae bacterium]|nr:prepilin-type N-terminal cleavage/methylation domain-containing protein [Phycisphaerae bacterium]